MLVKWKLRIQKPGILRASGEIGRKPGRQKIQVVRSGNVVGRRQEFNTRILRAGGVVGGSREHRKSRL